MFCQNSIMYIIFFGRGEELKTYLFWWKRGTNTVFLTLEVFVQLLCLSRKDDRCQEFSELMSSLISRGVNLLNPEQPFLLVYFFLFFFSVEGFMLILASLPFPPTDDLIKLSFSAAVLLTVLQVFTL